MAFSRKNWLFFNFCFFDKIVNLYIEAVIIFFPRFFAISLSFMIQ